MENNFDHLLTRKIKQTLENHHLPYQEGAWEEFSRRYLQPQAANTFFRRLRFAMPVAAMLLTCLVIAATFYYAFHSINSGKKTNSSTGKNSVIADFPDASPLTAPSVPKSQHLQKRAFAQPNKSVSAQQKAYLSTTTLDKPTSPSVKHAKLKQSTSLPLPAKQTVQEQNLIHSAGQEIAFSSKIELADVLPLSPQVLAQLPRPTILPQKLPTVEQERYANVVKVAPTISFTSGFITGKGLKNTAPFYGGGLGAELLLHDRISITANLQWFHSTYETAEKKVRTLTGFGRDPNPPFHLVPMYAEEIGYKHIRLHLLQLPLTVKYYLRPNFYLNAGSISYLTTPNMRIESITQSSVMGVVRQVPVQHSESQLSPFGAFYLGTGFKLPFENASLHIEPYAAVSFRHILPEVNKASVQWIGINATLQYGQ
ncbi:MAG: hypothetical protein RMJ44_03445 [Cytophagales bacterium]|nr:hypothetical protein [Bernardetiaceae bacterium]MDW8210119.1 hypothetical protein [Cytophagales bacterium]